MIDYSWTLVFIQPFLFMCLLNAFYCLLRCSALIKNMLKSPLTLTAALLLAASQFTRTGQVITLQNLLMCRSVMKQHLSSTAKLL